MKSRYVLGNIKQLYTLTVEHPSLKTIRAIGNLEHAFKELKECSTCNGKTPPDFKAEFETAMLSLSSSEAARFKKIIGVDRLGFYTKAPSGKFELHMLYD